MPLLLTDHITLRYDRVTAVDDLSFSLNRGDYLCIVGENGSGKSSLIKAMLGLIPVAQGSIRFEPGFTSRQIGYLPQQTTLQRNFPATVQEIVLSGCLNSMGLRPFYTKRERMRSTEAMQRLNIEPLAEQSYHHLSGGQQQRVLLARALCATQQLLLLDEPAAGLDPLVTADLYRLIESLNHDEGITVIMVSHDIAAAVTYASHILHLHHSPLFYGKTADYLTSEVGRRFTKEGSHA